MNAFDILGIPQGADKEAQKRAYRKLCAKYHPDNAKTGNRVKFDEVQKAWGILNGKVSTPIIEPVKKAFVSHVDLFTFSTYYG